jgi:hypothetical protein
MVRGIAGAMHYRQQVHLQDPHHRLALHPAALATTPAALAALTALAAGQ